MGSTGVVTDVIQYLSFIKIKNNLSQIDVSLEFDKILENWEQITIFVKAEDKKEEIYSKIKSFMERRLHVFFVFAFGSASPIAMQAIAQLHNDRTISNESYLPFVIPKMNLVGTEIYTWSFELIPKSIAGD